MVEQPIILYANTVRIAECNRIHHIMRLCSAPDTVVLAAELMLLLLKSKLINEKLYGQAIKK